MPTAGHQQYSLQHTSFVHQPVPLQIHHPPHGLPHRSVDAQVVIALQASAGGQNSYDLDAAHRHDLASSSLQSDGAHSPTRLRGDSAQHLWPVRHGYPRSPNGEQHSHATPNQQRRSSHHGDSSCSSCPTCGAAWQVQGRREKFSTPRVLDTPQVRRFWHGSSEESKNLSSCATNSLVEQLETATQEDIRERIRTLRLTHSFLARPEASEEDAKDAPILEMKISASEAMLKELQNGVTASIKPSSQPATNHEGRSAPSGIELDQWVGGADGDGAAGPTGHGMTGKNQSEQYALWTKPLESGGKSYGQTAVQEDNVKDVRERIRMLRLTHSLLARPDASEEDAQAAQILGLKISANETMLRKLQDGVETSIRSNAGKEEGKHAQKSAITREPDLSPLPLYFRMPPSPRGSVQPVWSQEGAREQCARTKPSEPPQASRMRGELESTSCDPVDPSTGSSASAAVTADAADDAVSFNADFNGDNYTTIPETSVQDAPISISNRPPLPPPASKPVYTSSPQPPPVPPRTSLEGWISAASREDLARLRMSEYSQAHAHGRPSPSPALRIPLHDLLQQRRTGSPAFSARLEQLPTMSEVLYGRSTPWRGVYEDLEDAPSPGPYAIRAASSPGYFLQKSAAPSPFPRLSEVHAVSEDAPSGRAAPSPGPFSQKSAAPSPFLRDVYADSEDAPSVRATPSPFLQHSLPRTSRARDPTLPAGQSTPDDWIQFSTSPQTMNPRVEPDVAMAQSSNTNLLIASFKSQASANHRAPSPSQWLC
jgi:hypothetical protein